MVRTVSLLPAATEIVGALGLMDQLLAVSHECDFPAEANRRPRVTFCEIYGKDLPSDAIDRWVAERLNTHGTIYTLDEAKLRELAPDLILTQQLCNVCAPAFDSVEELAKRLPSRPRLLNLEPKSLADILDNVEDVAAAMGHAEAGAAVRRQLERRIQAVQDRVRGLRPPSVFLMEWADPIFTAGHWNPELIRLAGGTPLLSREGQDSIRVPWEELRAADPEVIVIACCGHGVERTKQDLPILEALPGWQQLRAVQGGRVHLANGSAYFSRPGPRIVDSLEMMATTLHPNACSGAFPDRDVLPAY